MKQADPKPSQPASPPLSLLAALLWALASIFGLLFPPPVQAESSSQQHWAYLRPVRPATPEVKDHGWARNELDRFILARLEREEVAPSAEAEPARLLRRVSLDLTGLLPDPEQVEAFLAEKDPGSYERWVDGLLASPQYGERWARHWLDLARYADSNGFQRDGFRDLWAYRDWVIKAFNADMPFDQFTIEQLAGDLLPEATLAQKIATGFNRCPTVNVEAGTDQEENRFNQVIDRVNTTATVWLGTSVQCAQCHDHKFDPVSQREYYQLFAFFNNTAIETEFRTAKETAAIDFVGPSLKLPVTADFQMKHRRLEDQINQLKRQLKVLANTPTQGDQKQVKTLKQELGRAEKKLLELKSPQTLVMRELESPRLPTLFVRGNFLDPGEPVQAGTPGFLHAMPEGPPNRLTLARWLASQENPLLARVTVNRWWAEIFGRGLVSTPEDFGKQGAKPTHPELLDWLAVDLMEKGWSMKALHRQIVLSATYRQASTLTPALLRLDPENKLYTRGPRFRMDAEMIRDTILTAAGLLSLKQGGPSVKPYQPEEVWRVTGLVDNTYTVSEGEDRYRRGVYTVWRRSAPYPSFVNFDAPSRSACVVKRSRSNTPLQALTLLNDPVYVEAAKGLAHRLLADWPDAGTTERLRYGFVRCLTRPPRSNELDPLLGLFKQELKRFQGEPDAARVLIGHYPLPPEIDPAEFAAWFHIATVLLNLDEMITKS